MFRLADSYASDLQGEKDKLTINGKRKSRTENTHKHQKRTGLNVPEFEVINRCNEMRARPPVSQTLITMLIHHWCVCTQVNNFKRPDLKCSVWRIFTVLQSTRICCRSSLEKKILHHTPLASHQTTEKIKMYPSPRKS